MSWQERLVESGIIWDFNLEFLRMYWTIYRLMKVINHMRCYVAGKIQKLWLHLIVTSIRLCVIVELGLITWPKNFVVGKLLEIFSYSETTGYLNQGFH